MPGLAVAVLGALGIAASAALIASCLRLSSLVSFLLAVYVVATVEVVAVSLALSPASWLTRGAFLASLVILGLGAVVMWHGLGRPRPPVPADLRSRLESSFSDRAVLALVAVVTLVYVYVLAVGLTVPQSVVDAMIYHLPRAAFWRQQHAVAYVANSPEEPINAHPPNAEIQTMASMLLSGGDHYVALAQLVAVLATSIGIFGLARRIGLDRRAAAFGALLYPTFSVVVLQASTALNDLVLAALLVCAAYFVAGAATRVELCLFALALAAAFGTKLSTLFAVPVLAVFAATSQPRRHWLGVAIAGAFGLLAGSYWYVVNLVETGKLDGGLASAFPQGGDGTVVGTLGVARRLATDLLELSAGEGHGTLRPVWIGLVVAGLIALGAVIAWARDRHAAAAGLVVMAVFAFFAAPTAVVWWEIFVRGARRACATVGIGTASTGSRLPAGYLESPMHSAYGLAFVLLLIAVGVIVVSGAIRGTVSYAAVAAVAGVPLFLALFAIPFHYDPMRMRFFAFPAALAASTFGIALRVRALAWSAVGLTCVTLLVLIGYAVPRPFSVAVISGNRDPERGARWQVQGDSGHWSADPDAFRFLQNDVPLGSTLALAVVRDTYVYPAWNAGLDQHVVFVPNGNTIPAGADWLVVGPRDEFDTGALGRPALETDKGWRVYRLTHRN